MCQCQALKVISSVHKILQCHSFRQTDKQAMMRKNSQTYSVVLLLQGGSYHIALSQFQTKIVRPLLDATEKATSTKV